MSETTPAYELLINDEKSSWAARENLHNILTRELLGPADGDDEILQMAPDTRYLVGRIAPSKIADNTGAPSAEGDDDPNSTLDIGDDVDAKQSTGVPLPSTDETTIDAEEDAAQDAPVKRGLMIPASMGLRFQIPLDIKSFTVRANWGTYEPGNTGKVISGTDRPERVFRRKHHDHASRILISDLKKGGGRATQRLEDNVTLQIDSEIDSAEGQSRSRRIIEVALCNNTETSTPIPVKAWMFQTQLYIESEDGQPIFLPVHDPLYDPERPTEDDELKRLDLQYRDQLEFAIGRTCSVDWAVADGARQATQVRTTWLPTSETPQTLPGETPGAITDMRTLADAAETNADILDAGLRPIVDGYAAWLDQKRDEATTLPPHLRSTAEEAIDEAVYVHAQLADGLSFLQQNEEARRCFAFMNTVMADQRVRNQVAALRIADPTLELDEAAERVAARGPGAHSWRTFQLAFVLMQVHGLCDPTYARRSADNLARVELLFFPTGGGKTEAYLGLAAFTFAIRRLQGVIDTPDGPLNGGAGVNVLMRYTLRLLTSQQFQRAAALVCAAELERRKDVATWGEEPFRIGLWVGTNVSPKYVKAAAEELKNVNDGHGHRLTVLQVKRCPWCGTLISPSDISVDEKAGRVHVYCGEEFGECPFSRHGDVEGGLPILTVDEEIYRLAPAFLIATVDKFARLAREGQAAHLFGYVGKKCDRHGYVHPDDRGCDGKGHRATGTLPAAESHDVVRLRPIDLIIQDELHLITGALGTAVGLFEIAIDVLTTWQTADGAQVKPLLVASTATVRNAGDQSKGLYGRLPLLFPPRVLDAADTYFSTEVPVSKENPGRRYIGVSTTGVRITTAEIRVAEILMAGGQLLIDRLGKAVDPYMTLVGYFNATRELAGMSRYVQDDVQTALAKGRRGIGLPRRVGTAFDELNLSELTSRVSGVAITDTLDQMALTFDPAFDSTSARRDRRTRRAANQPVPKRDTAPPFDVVLATSMLQVGVDVTRLGLMLMVGQPKNTAEYIQASSRVGRDPGRPGLVVTLGNWARPRDLAHYEAFRHYHETFYAQVEPLSVTPFSVTSLERGLAGVLVSAIRVLEAPQSEGLSPETKAWRIKETAASQRVSALIDKLVARAAAASPDPLTEDAVRRRLDTAVGLWKKRQISVTGGERKSLAYEKIRGKNESDFAPLIRGAENLPSAAAQTGPPFVIANSLREVQPEINILVTPQPENLIWRPSDDTPQWAPQPNGDQI